MEAAARLEAINDEQKVTSPMGAPRIIIIIIIIINNNNNIQDTRIH